MNAGPIIHPPLITMNAGPIEHFDKWDIHKEGTQPAIRRVTDALDAERIAIREALGYGAPHFACRPLFEGREPWMYARDAHDQLTDFRRLVGTPDSCRAPLHAGGSASRPVLPRVGGGHRRRANATRQGVPGDRLRHHGTGFRDDGPDFGLARPRRSRPGGVQNLLTEGFQ